MASRKSLRLFCSHGAAVFYIALHPGCTSRDLADVFVVTQRTVWGLIGDLKDARLINIRKEGRVNHYTIKEDAPFPDPVLSHTTLGHVFRVALCLSDSIDA